MGYILLAEDEPAIRGLMSELLRDTGYVVFEAADGASATSRAQADPPGLLVLDLMLPAVDGWDLLRGWKADPQLAGVPVLVVSASYATDVERALELGASAALAKPFDLDAFLAAVEELFGPP